MRSAASPSDYGEARACFLHACARIDGDLRSYAHPLTGPDQETLATDVFRVGALDARHLAIVISGTHGPEGLMGSHGQTGFLEAFGGDALRADTALVLVHLINPWGTAWRRRQTEDNVDLNRNFPRDWSDLPVNPHYDDLKAALHEADDARSAAAMTAFREERGMQTFAAAVFQGQYHDALGVGFGGVAPVWSHRTLAAILEAEAAHARSVCLLDLHSGIGPFGHATLLHMGGIDNGDELRLRARLGPDLVAFGRDRGTMPYTVSGDLCSGVVRMLGDRRTVALVAEFGTGPVEALLDLQIEDSRALSRNAALALRSDLRRSVQDFFYPPDADWRSLTRFRIMQLVQAAIDMARR